MEPKLIKVVTADGQVVHVPPGASVYVDGMCVPDPTPVEMPVGYEHPESLESMLLRLVHQVSRGQADIGEETIDDANDFDVDDDEVLEDTFTDSELHAILSTPEMKEQFLRDQEEKKREQASAAARASARGEEDDYPDDELRSRGDRRDVRRRVEERDSRVSDRGREEMARRGEERKRGFEEDSEDA